MVFRLLMKIIDSSWHVYGLILLGIVLVVLPLLGVHMSSFIELLGGNYTNVISAIGATIAASTTLKTRSEHHLLRKEIAELKKHLHKPPSI